MKKNNTNIHVIKTSGFIVVNTETEQIIWENKYGFVLMEKEYLDEAIRRFDEEDEDLGQIIKVAKQFIYKTEEYGLTINSRYSATGELWEDLTSGNIQRLASVTY